MSDIFPPVELQFGDCLLYSTKWDLVDIIIRIKSWSVASHVEVYVGGNQSVASRNGIGVNKYPLRREGLVAVLRPKAPLDRDAGMAWFYSQACGQKYDFLGLMCFFLAVKRGSPDRQFCSEFSTNFYRACQFEPFNADDSADTIAPGTNLFSSQLEHVWKNF